MVTRHTADQLAWLEARNGTGLSLLDLVDAGIDVLPQPGAGHTLARWQVLAAVAAHDLSLAKLFEGHTDALAIQAELGAPAPDPGSLWGTWCAEPPDARVTLARDGPLQQLRIAGTKAWCSGAASLTRALVSGWNEEGEPCLAVVELAQPGVTVTGQGWEAVGMAGQRQRRRTF